jgi:CHASE3 domain sensor protein
MGKWFDQLRIQSKLFGILSFIILIGTLITMWNVYSVIRIDAESHHMLHREKELDDIEEVHIEFLRQAVSENEFLLTGDMTYVDRHEAERSLAATYLWDALLEASGNQEKAALYSIQRQGDAYAEDFEQVVATYQNGNSEDAAKLSRETSQKRILQIHETIESLVGSGIAAIDAEGQQADRQAVISLSVGIAGMVLFVLLAVLIVSVAVNQIGRPILVLHEAITLVGMGNFDPTMLEPLARRSDEIGRLARAVIDMGTESEEKREALEDQVLILRGKITHVEQMH